MTWGDFFLVCFIVGFGFSLLSFFAGIFDLHLPDHSAFSLHGHDHLGHTGHFHDAHGDSTHVSPFNLATIMAFLAWFGGAGFLLVHYSGLALILTFGISIVVGLTGASFVFWFLAKVLVAHDHTMKSADYDMTGILAVVNSSIREGGTGEIVFSQAGSRKCAAARSENGSAISKGEEVLVLRYEKGIAYVSRWEEMAVRSGPPGETGTRIVAGERSDEAGQ
jgi:hypothetical protein